jgi:glycosyltransferase involved in cell wall biosynthesis
MAQGVPAIASPVPSYFELFAENQGGEICATIEDWDKTLAMIMDDRQILARWSNEARLAIMPFTTQQIAGKYADLFSQL